MSKKIVKLRINSSDTPFTLKIYLDSIAVFEKVIKKSCFEICFWTYIDNVSVMAEVQDKLIIKYFRLSNLRSQVYNLNFQFPSEEETFLQTINLVDKNYNLKIPQAFISFKN